MLNESGKYLYRGTWEVTKDEYLPLKLWEDDHRTIAGKLICEHGFKGDKAIKAIKGGWLWEAFTKSFRVTFLRSLRQRGVAFEIVVIKKGMSVLMLGRDRCKLAQGIKQLRRRKVITKEQRADFLLRLAKGEFPNPDDEYETAIEFDLLVSS